MQVEPQNATKKVNMLYLITKSNFGGAQKYVFDLATSEIVKDNYNIAVVLGGNGELKDRLDSMHIDTINIQSLSNSLNPFKLLTQIVEIRKVLKIKSPNILHINSSMAALAGVFAVLSINILREKDTKIKVVFTAHGWPFNENRNVFEKVLLKFLICFIVYVSDRTICVSNKTKSELPRIIQKKCVVIYNGIEEASKNKDKHKIINREKYDIDTVHLVSVGELHYVKGHDMVIEALENLKRGVENKNIHYHILGEGSYRQELESLIKKLEMQNKVTLHGYIKNAREYIDQADIFIMPSRSEALGFALLEGYASGIPVIATSVGGMPEIVENYAYGELTSANTNNIYISLVKVLENLEDYKTVAKNENQIPLIFTKKHMIEETLRVYSVLLHS